MCFIPKPNEILAASGEQKADGKIWCKFLNLLGQQTHSVDTGIQLPRELASAESAYGFQKQDCEFFPIR